MTCGIAPYPAMKDSGVSWLGSVPSHWKVLRAGQLLREVDVRSKTGNETHLSMSQRLGLVPSSEMEERRLISESYVGAKLCQVDDLVLNRLKAHLGVFARASQPGLVSPDYTVLRAVSREGRIAFLESVLKSLPCRTELRMRAKGVVEGFWRLYTDDFYQIKLPVPPIPEQADIIRFVDHADRRIRRYIRAKHTLIKLLEEQRRAIVYHAVTRGLDPNVRLRPRRAEWIGHVPEHWNTSRVKTEFLCLNNRRVPLSGTERGNMTLRRYDYYGASGVIDKVDEFLFDDELLLIAEDGANLNLRNLPLAIVARGKFWVNNHAHILKPKRGNLEYLAALMETIDYRPWISGAAQPKLTQDRLMSITIVVPPPSEQDRIIRWLDGETASLRVTVQGARREIDLLREYRNRLIADVVTGKLDVREAAARLPEDASDEPLDEADAEVEREESAEQVEAVAEEAGA